jgi:chromosome segregation ATPase
MDDRDDFAAADQWERVTREALARAKYAEAHLKETKARTTALEVRARESERAREQIAINIAAARRDVYNANLRVEQSEARLAQAEARANQAERKANEAEARAMEAEAKVMHVEQQRDAVLRSTAWRATWPLRAVAHRLPPGVRGALRRGPKFAWWSSTLGLSRRLGEWWRASRTFF